MKEIGKEIQDWVYEVLNHYIQLDLYPLREKKATKKKRLHYAWSSTFPLIYILPLSAAIYHHLSESKNVFYINTLSNFNRNLQ